jgi:hypothetical protein
VWTVSREAVLAVVTVVAVVEPVGVDGDVAPAVPVTVPPTGAFGTVPTGVGEVGRGPPAVVPVVVPVAGVVEVEPAPVPPTGRPLMVLEPDPRPGAGAAVGRLPPVTPGKSPFPPLLLESEPGVKPGCSRPAAVPVPAGRPVGVGIEVEPEFWPSAPTAGVELAEDGGAPTLGMVGARVDGVWAESPFAEVDGFVAEVLEAGGATKA